MTTQPTDISNKETQISTKNYIQQTFSSDLTNGKEIRCFGTSEEPWFVAKDIAEILEYKNTRKAIKDHIDSDDILSIDELINQNGVNNKNEKYFYY
jgi:prophage antirepressor-like protein